MFSRIASMTPLREADRAGDLAAGNSPSPEPPLLRLQQAALENTANAIVIANVKGVIQWTNPAFTTLTGYTAAEARGRTPALLKSGEHDQSFYAELWRTVLSGQTWRGEFTNRRKDGGLYQGEQVITPVRGDGGDITHFVAVMNDVTARRQAEAAQRDAHRQLQHLLDHSPAVIYALKWEHDRVVPHTVSENITRLLGFTVKETTRAEWWSGQLHPDDRERAVASIAETLAHETSQMEYRLRHRDGTYRWVEDHRRLVRDAAGQPSEFIGVWTDITERKRAEEVLRATAAQRPKQLARRIAIELGVIVVGAGLVFAGEIFFGWFESTFAILANEATHPLADETAVVVAFLLLAMVVFSIRRWRESRAEAIAQHNLAGALNTLHAELELRVRQRTAELARANEGLRAEVVERTRANEALWQSEERYRALVDTAPTGIFVNVDDRFAYVNTAMCRIFGAISPEELLGKVTLDRIHPDSRVAVLDRIRRGRGGESVPLIDHRYLRLDGSVVEVETVATPISFHGQRAIQVIVNDITGRRRAEQELRVSERRFHDMLMNVELIAMTLDSRGCVTFCNDHLLRLTGWQRDEVVGADWMAKFLPDSESAIREQFFATIEAGLIPAHHENPIKTRTGELRDIVWNNTILRDATGKIVGTASIGEDVTERKRAAARLALQYAVTEALAEGGSQERTIQRMLETIGRSLQWDTGELWLVDRSAQVLRCTQTWSSTAGEFSDFAAASRQLTFARGVGLAGGIWELGREEWIADVSQQADCPRRAMIVPTGLRSWVGFPIKLRQDVVGVVGFFSRQARDADPELIVTLAALGHQLGQFIEREQLAEQFRQAQKMEAIGTLAGGIAHDFNNIIAAISGYTELAKMEVPAGTSTTKHLDAVLTGSKRAASLVHQILAFSRQQEHERRPIQLRHIVAEALTLLRATIPATVEFETHLHRDLPAVLADATQIHQSVMNLCTNAAHAMRHRAGKLTVTLEAFPIDAGLAEVHPGLRVGPYVRLSIGDTGHGMDQATVARIFDPFFTTKAPGEGTGLGLAVVHGIMQSHEGIITVYSHPGEGSIFRLYFPSCEVAETNPAPDEAPAPRGHGERVLYVDDEEMLALMSKRALEQLGYTVDTQTNPGVALEVLRADPRGYDLVITDFAMPGLTGVEFACEVLKVRPNLPIILVTGYAANLSIGQVKGLGIRELLLKPHSFQSLALTVARVLSEKPS